MHSLLFRSIATTKSRKTKQRSVRPGIVKRNAGFLNVYDPESLVMFAPKGPNSKMLK
jgi:hypothetical protein